MSISGPFIRRPVATTLLTAAVALAGILAFQYLPVAPVPQVEYPTINIHANLPGASPEVMASAVATPLERQFGRIAGVTEMTSSSELGSTSITLQFDLSRDVNAAARDVQASINAARGQLPADMPSNPRYWKVNPASAPIMILALTSKTVEKPAIFDAADSILAQKLSERFSLATQRDLGEVKLKISGCINACGHHHAGHIGILGVDRHGTENYQLSFGGSGAEDASLAKIVGPGFSEDGVVDAVEKALETYRSLRTEGERFLDTYRRVGLEPFKAAIYA